MVFSSFTFLFLFFPLLLIVYFSRCFESGLYGMGSYLCSA